MSMGIRGNPSDANPEAGMTFLHGRFSSEKSNECFELWLLRGTNTKRAGVYQHTKPRYIRHNPHPSSCCRKEYVLLYRGNLNISFTLANKPKPHISLNAYECIMCLYVLLITKKSIHLISFYWFNDFYMDGIEVCILHCMDTCVHFFMSVFNSNKKCLCRERIVKQFPRLTKWHQ